MKQTGKCRWGIIGTSGNAAKNMLPGMAVAQGCELYAIAGRRQDKVQEYCRRFGIENGYVGYDKIIEDPRVDIVYITTPNHLHTEWAVKAAKAGKHVFCEKPMCPTEKELRELFAVCEQNQVKIMEAFPFVHSPVLARVKEIIASGEIGRVLNVCGIFIAPRHPKSNVRMRRDTLGGAMYDLGCYNTALALEIFDREPEKVAASAIMTDENIDDCSTVLLDFSDGRRAVSVCGMVLTAGDRHLNYRIYGEEGGIAVPEHAYNISGEIPVEIFRKNGEMRREIISSRDNYALEVEQFQRCVLWDEPYRFSHERSLQNARILDAVFSQIGYY